VVDTALVTAMGPDLDALWDGLVTGRTAIAPIDRFDTSAYSCGIAACLPGLTPPPGGSMIFPLADLVLDQLGAVPRDASLVAATTKGGIDALERVRRTGEPCRGLLPADAADHVAARFGLAPGITISAACASSTIAVARGASLIASGAATAVLVFAADLVTEFVHAGFAALQALSPDPCRPFDRKRSGLTLGEGAVAILLMSPDRAEAEGRVPLASVLGWGVANDAHHVTAPIRDGSGLVRAVTLALDGKDPDGVGAVSAHGTGTVYNDLMELAAYQAVFGDRPRPLWSVKGAIGHTLGAAGGIEVAVAARALRERTAPPTVGMTLPEAGAEALVSGAPRPIVGDSLLVTNSGFGGINAALLLGRCA
jgi:3-oxoacyl-[acyl-carrier-protein] synthase II